MTLAERVFWIVLAIASERRTPRGTGRNLRDSADFRIYTPASSAGIPVSILKSFAAPAAELLDDAELMRERIGTTVTSLLGLVGIDADPVQSREYILLSTIIENLWRKGQDLDLAQPQPSSSVRCRSWRTFAFAATRPRRPPPRATGSYPSSSRDP